MLRDQRAKFSSCENVSSFEACGKADMLKAFYDRLRGLCAENGASSWASRRERIEGEAKQARAAADEFGILRSAGTEWAKFRREADLHVGSEHVVELSVSRGRVGKMTIPGAFGLMPLIVEHPVVNLRNDPSLPATRRAIEFGPATPLEYLSRWVDANDLFNDDVSLTSLVEWDDGQLSFGITQPQYDGAEAPLREIEEFFVASGWSHIVDPSGPDAHLLFFNYAWEVLAIDALPRNCFIHDEALLPFDVILCRPDAAMEEFLSLY